MEFKKASKLDPKSNLIFLITNDKELPTSSFTKEELSFIKKELKNEHKQIEINRLNSYLFVILCEKEEGYKAAEKGKSIELNLGYSHPINFPVPEGLKIEVPKPTQIKISGIDKQKVGQTASEIRSFRKPEPFKGKGIKYKEEIIRRKEGKKK